MPTPCKTCGGTERYKSRGCKLCARSQGLAAYHADPIRAMARTKKWVKANKEHIATYRMLYKYGLTKDQFLAMMALQGGRCVACRKVMKAPVIDHDHKTGKVRGLMCSLCNTALGLLKENTKTMANLINYVEVNHP